MSDKDRFINETFLEELLNASAPTGSEQRAQRVYREYLKDIADEIDTDILGNVNAVLNPQGSPKIMLAGHCDEVGMQVRYIDDKGFIFVHQLGGLDPHIVPGHRVMIMTKNQDVYGIIGRKAIHLIKSEDRKKVTELKEQYIDVGASSREEVEELGIKIGDPIVFTEKFWKLGNKGVVVSRCFDDRIAVFIIAEVLRLLKSESFDACVCGVSTTQEEIGTRGAIISSYGINPDIGIAIDVTGATGTPDVSEKDHGKVLLGNGPVLTRGPNINSKLFDMCVKAAETDKIPIQRRAAPRPTGTDARSIQMTRNGVVTGLIGIPNRYMHSMNETVHLDDIENTIQLLVALIKKISKDTSFIPE